MRNAEKDAREMAERRQVFLETAFHLFAERNIDTVSLAEIAKASGYGLRTLHRYFQTKDDLVLAVAVRSWEDFLHSSEVPRPRDGATASEAYACFVDSFLTLYHDHAGLLRFNQFFNVYVRSQRISPEQMRPYQSVADALRTQFHGVYLRGQKDGTLRTDVPEAEIFDTTLHLMLAAVTRYAVGLVYLVGADTEAELATLREMLLRQYTIAP